LTGSERGNLVIGKKRGHGTGGDAGNLGSGDRRGELFQERGGWPVVK